VNKLVNQIKSEMETNFINLRTALLTYDRNAPVCGAPAWRYAYHVIHSCDKWFIDPFDYTDPDFQPKDFDKPDTPSELVISDKDILAYLDKVIVKINDYLDGLDDSQLLEKPKDCPYTRFELVLGQFRHMNTHIGLINGQTVERTNRFPVVLGMNKEARKRLDNSLYDE